MSTQGVITVVTEILPDRVDALISLLDGLQAALDGDVADKPIIEFQKLERVHFARFSVLPPDSAGRRHLTFASCYDGPEKFHWSELGQLAGPGLATIYAHCVGFPSGAAAAPATLVAFLSSHAVRHGALHVGYVGRTVRDIADEEALRRFIERTLDEIVTSDRDLRKRSATKLRKLVIDAVRGSEHAFALEPRKDRIGPTHVDGFWSSARTVAVVAAVLVGGGVIAFFAGNALGLGLYVLGVAGALGLLAAALRHHELTEPAKTDTDYGSDQHAEDEDFSIRNELTHLADIKPGLFRHALLRAVLAAVEFRARFQFYTGDLGGIETIHCAHWAILDGDRSRLLFNSNYDGSWERYLGDFIEEAGGGMTSVWSNTVDFPRARFLLWDGAANERVFKAWTREHQVRTQVWYQALPEISIHNVNGNSRIRDGLRGFMTEEEAAAWLKLL